MCLDRRHFQLKPSKLGTTPCRSDEKNQKSSPNQNSVLNSNGQQTNINGQIVK